MPATLDQLYALLPALYRERDAQEGYPLQGLLRIITEQAALVEGDIRQLYENLFIETCQPWVIPYIGDLVSNNLLYDTSRLAAPYLANQLFDDLAGKDLNPPVAIRVRADVAKTIYYRRRKGTLPMLEELARDVTGWPAHAVEFFELLGWMQHLEHLRLHSRWTDVRAVERMERINGPFDETSHTVDVRRISQVEGWHNIHNIGFFFWRLHSYPLQQVPARPVAPAPSWRFHFSPLGNPAPLFTPWRREGDEAGLATELHVPAPIRRAFFYEDLVRYANLPAPKPDYTDLYGMFAGVAGVTLDPCPECSFFILMNGAPVLASQIVCRRLDPWPATQPTGNTVAIDVAVGRLALGTSLVGPLATESPHVDVLYHYGFSADMGGGPYERQKWFIRPELAQVRYRVKEDGVVPPGAPAVTHTSVTAALADWASATAGQRRHTIITILDSRTYQLPTMIELSNEHFLAIEAANGERPLLQTDPAGLAISVHPPANPTDPDRRAELTLNGVVIEGWLHVTGDMGRLRLLHTTLIPGRQLTGDGQPQSTEPSLRVDGAVTVGPDTVTLNSQLRVEVAFSITGPLVIPDHADGLWLLDSIVDGLQTNGARGLAIAGPTGAGPRTTLERTTVLGRTHVKTLEASETIFVEVVETVRTQDGCVRFSFVKPGSRTPRRYHCQPDLAVDTAIKQASEHNPVLSQTDKDHIRQFIEGYLTPSFTSLLYGRPAYTQLHLSCPVEISTGAEDGSEMGAFSHLKQPQRESNLRIRLKEYVPFGLDAGIIYVT